MAAGPTPVVVVAQTSIFDAVESIALSDPISTILVLVGSVLIGVSTLVFGGLSAGAAIDFLTPE